MSRILVTDDDPVSRLMLRHILVNDGHEVIEADSAADALTVFGDEPADLVLCDYHMPGGSGLELVEFFVEHAIPFVLLTGVAEHGQLDDQRADLVSAYLTKPVSSQDLTTVVAAVMDRATAST